jgi:hypothetical protein
MTWMRVSLLPLLLLASCSEEGLLLRSSGSACSSSDQCESNLCYESRCVAPPRGETEAPSLEEDEPPTDCTAMCAHVFACEQGESGTEEECVVFCDDHPEYFPPRVGACAEVYLADGQCEEAGFEACAEGPILGFFQAVAAEVCAGLVECCSGGEASPFGDVTECSELVSVIAGGFMNATEIMGYITFDEAVAETCEATIELTLSSTECANMPQELGPFLGDLLACEGLITPLQGQGDPCGIPSEGSYVALEDGCTGNLRCLGEAQGMPTCEPGVPPGGECSEEGTKCGRESACVDGVCLKRGDLGAACSVDRACESGACDQRACRAPWPLDCGP